MSERDDVVEMKSIYWTRVKRRFSQGVLAKGMLFFVGLYTFLVLFADFIANEKPIYCKYKYKNYFPLLKSYAVGLGLSDWTKELYHGQVSWSHLEYDKVVFPLVPYSPRNLDYKNIKSTPFGDQRVKSIRWRHWLGTDGMGRDFLSQLVHVCRKASFVFLTLIGLSTAAVTILASSEKG